MFDIGFFELILVAIVGLVVIGPERLPDTVRTVALYIGRLKRSLRDTRQELEQQLGADDIRRQLHNEEVMRSLDSAKNDFQESLSDPLDSYGASYGGAGDETSYGGTGDETAQAHAGDETAQAHAGDETAQAHAGDETAQAHAGDETAQAHAGDETAQSQVHIGDEVAHAGEEETQDTRKSDSGTATNE